MNHRGLYKINTRSPRAWPRKHWCSFDGDSPWVWLTSLILLMLVVAPVVADAVSCDFPTDISQVRPDPEGTPTRVSVGLYIIDLQRIDNVKQTLAIDFLMAAQWEDPRLASDARSWCRVDLDTIWHPDLLILNEENLAMELRENVDIDSQGNVFYAQRFIGTISAPLDLRNFPFDHQTLSIILVDETYTADELTFTVNERRTGHADTFSIADWSLGPPTIERGVFYFAPSGKDIPSLEYRVEATRLPFYYFLKIVFPLTMIILVSWVVFWLNPSHLGTQLGLSATTIVILGIFQLALRDLLPRIPYMTRMDYFLLGSQILVFLALLEAVTSGVLAERNPAVAQRLDWWSRRVFPTVFAVLVLFAFLL